MPKEMNIRILNILKTKIDLNMLEFTPHLIRLMASSDLIIAMAGYNSITEILSMNKKAIVIPRIIPTKEQLIRAELFSKNYNAIKMLHPDQLKPESLYVAIKDHKGKKRFNYQVLSTNSIKVVYDKINFNE